MGLPVYPLNNTLLSVDKSGYYWPKPWGQIISLLVIKKEDMVANLPFTPTSMGIVFWLYMLSS